MQNKHLEHPEDCILTGDLSVLDWMYQSDSKISVKIDGAPAVCWGRNPANGKFCVGTKAVFNKVKIRIAHSHEEIDQFYEGNVAQILHLCFDYLPRTQKFYQGDWIGAGGSQQYTPNTITYVFPEVVEQSIIVAPHTEYICEDDLRTAIAQPVSKRFVDTQDVKWIQPEAEICPYLDDIEDMCKFAKQMSTLCTFVNDKQAKKITQVINRYIREDEPIDYVAEYDIASECECDVNLIRLWNLVQSIKTDMFCFIEREDDILCFIDGEQTDHEGYVLSNQFGTYKIVDRQQFSRANFNMVRNW